MPKLPAPVFHALVLVLRAERNGRLVLPVEGGSLASAFRGDIKPRTLFIEHEGDRMVRDGDWKLVAQKDKS